ncbi:hypothetical protein GCM10007972_09110 [Iodidimonas muriae]|uniref:Cation/H+ exchanger transmembrane domain-containing protein n=1 Tax=Iodidimonas muriae TaxID=261467 RepID=A0ABQ2LAI7_9PROT|nr:potassium/proton antiporter [Iodidimonas muriae]GER06186.1 hypothetical protein JCM17843_04960 [Kordiimonadales bacterium JCM 17843]GGO08590.1 hypothetical protein GCM10007972_09110 [Iodidimonas muriae]
MDQLVLLSALLVFLAFLLIPLSHRLGAPILLLVLGVGMLAGEDGPGRINFDDFQVVHSLGGLALAIILFAGGLETDFRALRGAKLPAILLATIGVVLTALITGIPAHWILGVPLEQGLLLGAVVASTDAAATFLLIQHSRAKLPQRLKNTLVLESGLNDPMAIFLTLALTILVNSGASLSPAELIDFAPLLVMQLGIGLVAGLAGGWGLAALLSRLHLPDGIAPPLALAAALFIYAATSLMGGSGFLAIYLCGLVVAGRMNGSINRILHFNEGLQWLSQIGLFLMLGLLVKPSALTATWIEALVIAAVLMFVARPLAVALCTGPLRFRTSEQLFLGWVGLRGAVPIYLAIFPVITAGPVTVEFFNIVFVIVVASLVLQGWTVAPAARWLGLSPSEKANPENQEQS